MAGIDHERVALRAPEINRRGQTGDAAADNNDLAHFGIIEVGVFNHGVEDESANKV
jgi:hypothetical protein